jgi:hypothetical protein
MSEEGTYYMELVKFRDETCGQAWHPWNLFILYALCKECIIIKHTFLQTMPMTMFKLMMNQRKKWMMQEQMWLRSLLLAVNQDPLGMVWQVVTPLKGTKTWLMLINLGEMKKMVV